MVGAVVELAAASTPGSAAWPPRPSLAPVGKCPVRPVLVFATSTANTGGLDGRGCLEARSCARP